MGDLTGLAAVVMLFAIPLTAITTYGYYRVSKLRTEERLAALARGVNVPMEPELSQAGRSRRAGILLVAGAIGFVTTFALIARVEPDAWVAAVVRSDSVYFRAGILSGFDAGAARYAPFLGTGHS